MPMWTKQKQFTPGNTQLNYFNERVAEKSNFKLYADQTFHLMMNDKFCFFVLH